MARRKKSALSAKDAPVVAPVAYEDGALSKEEGAGCGCSHAGEGPRDEYERSVVTCFAAMGSTDPERDLERARPLLANYRQGGFTPGVAAGALFAGLHHAHPKHAEMVAAEDPMDEHRARGRRAEAAARRALNDAFVPFDELRVYTSKLGEYSYGAYTRSDTVDPIATVVVEPNRTWLRVRGRSMKGFRWGYESSSGEMAFEAREAPRAEDFVAVVGGRKEGPFKTYDDARRRADAGGGYVEFFAGEGDDDAPPDYLERESVVDPRPKVAIGYVSHAEVPGTRTPWRVTLVTSNGQKFEATNEYLMAAYNNAVENAAGSGYVVPQWFDSTFTAQYGNKFPPASKIGREHYSQIGGPGWEKEEQVIAGRSPMSGSLIYWTGTGWSPSYVDARKYTVESVGKAFGDLQASKASKRAYKIQTIAAEEGGRFMKPPKPGETLRWSEDEDGVWTARNGQRGTYMVVPLLASTSPYYRLDFWPRGAGPDDSQTRLGRWRSAAAAKAGAERFDTEGTVDAAEEARRPERMKLGIAGAAGEALKNETYNVWVDYVVVGHVEGTWLVEADNKAKREYGPTAVAMAGKVLPVGTPWSPTRGATAVAEENVPVIMMAAEQVRSIGQNVKWQIEGNRYVGVDQYGERFTISPTVTRVKGMRPHVFWSLRDSEGEIESSPDVEELMQRADRFASEHVAACPHPGQPAGGKTVVVVAEEEGPVGKKVRQLRWHRLDAEDGYYADGNLGRYDVKKRAPNRRQDILPVFILLRGKELGARGFDTFAEAKNFAAAYDMVIPFSGASPSDLSVSPEMNALVKGARIIDGCLPWVRVAKDPATFQTCLTKAREIGAIDDGKKVYDLLAPYLQSQDQEVYIVVLLDVKQMVRGVAEVARGQRSKVYVDPDDIMRIVNFVGASAFWACHNHPSGDPTPSRADIKLTKSIERESRLTSAEFAGHIVVGQGEWADARTGKVHKA